ncbi:hypothetical protein [Hymenobacter sp. YC55]|uniref:hypothetical protein n=1 Tax=Hymenobacter sp. YC55 TaxID=3034019 RepID=UPI0023F711B8|nr:hypothetical protein [Hymenobacter sp. YC55]MDF7813635.1 hypothetical protein [Hymenobacter sp. YC55]
MALILTTTRNHARRETTVTATDNGRFICSETMCGTGARVAAHLEKQVRAAAQSEMQRRLRTAPGMPLPQSVLNLC